MKSNLYNRYWMTLTLNKQPDSGMFSAYSPRSFCMYEAIAGVQSTPVDPYIN